jgi:hypothetical protein
MVDFVEACYRFIKDNYSYWLLVYKIYYFVHSRSRSRSLGSGRDSDLVSLCLALSLMGRRALGTAGHNALSTMEFFLVGLYSLFKVS